MAMGLGAVSNTPAMCWLLLALPSVQGWGCLWVGCLFWKWPCLFLIPLSERKSRPRVRITAHPGPACVVPVGPGRKCPGHGPPSSRLSLVESKHTLREGSILKNLKGSVQKLGARPWMPHGETNTASGDSHTGYSALEKPLAAIFQQSGSVDQRPVQLH